MAIEFFKPQYRTVQNPVDLNVLASTYNTLESKHLQAVELESKYKQALQELPLHPNEDAWVAQQGQAIQSAFNDNLNYGNAAAALDDLVRVWGDIKSNPGMKGRLRANQEYQNYMTNLESNKTLDEDTKAYYREKNKYYYQDTYDKNGNIIGGTEWKPIDREVAAPNMPAMMTRALQIAAKDAGGSNVIYYMDKNGQFTTNAAASVDGLPYMSRQGKYERLTQDKIKAAMDTVIANTPGAIEGLRQDYKIANWRHDKNQSSSNDLIIDETTDDKGLKLSFDQYMQKRLQGFYHSASYSHYYGTDTPLAGMSVQAAKARAAKGSGIGISDYIRTATNTTVGNYYIEKTSAISATVGQSKAATERLKGYADSLGVQFDLNDITGSYQRIVDKYNGVPPKEVYDTYKQYQTATARYEQLIPDGVNQDFKDKIAFCTALENGVDLSTLSNNKYVSEYVNFINKAFDNKEEIPIYLTDFNSAINNIDYKSLGLTIKTDANNRKYLSCDKNDSQNLYMIAKVVKPYIANVKTTVSGAGSGKFITTHKESTILDFVSSLYDNTAESVDALMGEPANIPTEIVSDMDVIQTMAQQYVDTGKFSDYKAARDYAADELEASLHNAWGPRLNMAIGYNNLPASYDNTSEQRFAAQQILRRARAKNKELTSIGYDKNTLKTVINITLTPELMDDDDIKQYAKTLGVDKGYNLTIVADNIFNNSAKNDIMKSPDWANSVDFTTAVNSGVHTFNLEDGNTIYTDGNIFEMESDGIRKSIDFNQAKKAVGANTKFNNLKYQYHAILASGQSITPEMAISIDKFIKALVIEYNPGIDINSSSFAAKVNDLKYELFNSTLD